MSEHHPEHQYLDLLTDIMATGYEKKEFNSGIALKSVFGRMMRFDLSQGFPLLTTKRVFWKGIIHELIWFLRGDVNIGYLAQNGVHIWDEWAYREYVKAAKAGETPEMSIEEFGQRVAENPAFARQWGELGPVYGRQWRRWSASDGREIDQLTWAIMKLKKYPDRKHVVVSAWNPEYIYEMAAPGTSMAIPPCHTMFQFNVQGDRLSCMLFQRSGDMFLGVPFNIASYALLTCMVAQVCGLKPGEFVHTLGDAHLYQNHLDLARMQLERDIRPAPRLTLDPSVTDLFAFTFDHVTVEGYDPHPGIKAPVAV